MNQTRNPYVVWGKRDLGDGDEIAPEALRLDKISEHLAKMHKLHMRNNSSDIDDANFGTSIGRAARSSGNSLENREWTDNPGESIDAMLTPMPKTRREPHDSEYGWSEDTAIEMRPNKVLISASALVAIITIGIAGYGFYLLGQKEADFFVPEVSVVNKTPETAGTDEGSIRIESVINKDLNRIAEGENAHTKPVEAPETDTAPVMADSAASLKTDRLPKMSTREAVSDSVQAERDVVKPVEVPVTAHVSPPNVISEPEGVTVAAGGAPAAAGRAPSAADTAPVVADKAPVVADSIPAASAAAPVVRAERIESLSSLTKSVVLAIVALGKRPDGGTTMGDPASVLRVRMTELISAASRQGKPLSDVQLILENALAELPAGVTPDVLKDADGKVNVTMLLSAITPAADKRR